MRGVGGTPGIAGDCTGNAFDMLKDALDAPEATAGEDSHFGRCLRVRRFIERRRRDRSCTLRRRREPQEADMSGAQLDRAVLTGADLRKANLRGAGFRGALLDEADLREARLGGAFLVRASLRGADLRGGAEWTSGDQKRTTSWPQPTKSPLR